MTPSSQQAGGPFLSNRPEITRPVSYLKQVNLCVLDAPEFTILPAPVFGLAISMLVSCLFSYYTNLLMTTPVAMVIIITSLTTHPWWCQFHVFLLGKWQTRSNGAAALQSLQFPRPSQCSRQSVSQAADEHLPSLPLMHTASFARGNDCSSIGVISSKATQPWYLTR